ncbi:MAG: AAC(3) family N-acetyltransferase [Anaerolineaceae bacterium]|nr:AAC(3) family N-acetyltransferase [Anaerolineaceae bacterium]
MSNITYRMLQKTLAGLPIPVDAPVIVHSSLSAIGRIQGAADTVIGALLNRFNSIMMPAFTYQTMIVPETGPEDNGIRYASSTDLNRMAIPFNDDLPVDKLMGITAAALQKYPLAYRSKHPILSFSGVHVEPGLSAQTLEAPFMPIEWLWKQNGWVLLMGVDHTVNTSLHLAEKIAGRSGFTRWAMQNEKIVTCMHFPGCSNGFNEAGESLEGISTHATLGEGQLTVLPLQAMVEIITLYLQKHPTGLLCKDSHCQRCQEYRKRYNKK